MEDPKEEQVVLPAPTSHAPTEAKSNTPRKCFVIMPLTHEVPGYDPGHFERVFSEIIQPACEQAEFEALPASSPVESHKIMTHILKSIVSYDMALCDLSSANPNVFYELGIRQMAKMPVAIIKDDITPNKFDVSNFRYQQYSRSLRSDLVKKEVAAISKAITQTYNNREAITSEFLNDISVMVQIDPKQMEISKGEVLLSEKLDLLLSKVGTNDFRNSSPIYDFIPDVNGAPIKVGDFYLTSFLRNGNLSKDTRDNIRLLTKILPEHDCIFAVGRTDAHSGLSTHVIEHINAGESGYKKLDTRWVEKNYPEEYQLILSRAGNFIVNK